MILDHSTPLPERTSRILIAADVRHLADVVDVLAQLPSRTKGQVFIEVQSPADVEVVRTPERVTLAWLVREARSGEPGTCEPCHPGVALVRATRAWVGEMVTGDPALDGGEVAAWVFGDAPRVLDLRDELAERLAVSVTR